MGVETVGHIPPGLPSFTTPNLALVEQLWPGALGIALMSFTESIAAARAFAGRTEPRPEPNRELLATGLANAVGGLFGAMPAGGGTSPTAVNRLAGAHTQVAALVTAGLAVATLVLLAPLMGLMPQATLAAVVIVYSVGLIQPNEFRDILRIRRMEFLWAVVACAGVVLLGTLKGILVAIIVSLVALSYQAARPRVYALGRKPGTEVFRALSAEHPEDETFPGLLMVRPEGRIFFANTQWVGEQITRLAHRVLGQLHHTAAGVDRALARLQPHLLGHRALEPRAIEPVEPRGGHVGRPDRPERPAVVGEHASLDAHHAPRPRVGRGRAW
jgi:MFS superfamily sulfate permease-like transporter